MLRAAAPAGWAAKTIVLPSGEKSGKIATGHVRDLLLVGAVLLHCPDLHRAASLARAVGDSPVVRRVGGAGVEARVGGQPAQRLPVRSRRVDVGVAVDVDAESDPPIGRARVGGAGRTVERGQSGERAHGGSRRDGESLLHVIPPPVVAR
jgi:hypothetical protein